MASDLETWLRDEAMREFRGINWNMVAAHPADIRSRLIRAADELAAQDNLIKDQAAEIERLQEKLKRVDEGDFDGVVLHLDAANARADALAARVAELEAALTEAEDTLQLCEHPSSQDPAHRDAVASLGDRIGYGALMSTASALWRDHLIARGLKGGGEFVSGPCRSTVLGTLKIIRAALHGAAPAGEGGGS